MWWISNSKGKHLKEVSLQFFEKYFVSGKAFSSWLLGEDENNDDEDAHFEDDYDSADEDENEGKSCHVAKPSSIRLAVLAFDEWTISFLKIKAWR